jgi:hypothetical protein
MGKPSPTFDRYTQFFIIDSVAIALLNYYPLTTTTDTFCAACQLYPPSISWPCH